MFRAAHKFTDKGEVSIEAEETGRSDGSARLRFTVTDSGIGIDPAQQKGLFQAFSQADDSTTRRYGGTGLGLSIVGSLASLMEGEVSVSSREGQGASFSFHIPVGLPVGLAGQAADAGGEPISPPLAQPPARELAPADVATAGTGAPRVLVVEDNPINRRVVESMLEKLGIKVRCAVNGVEGNAATLASPRPSLILMDCQMPVMDDFLPKPICREDLLQVLKKFIPLPPAA